MTRISVDPMDPGYQPGIASRYSVLFNGHLLQSWITADDIRCVVEVPILRPNGDVVYKDNGQPVTRFVRGQVTILGVKL